MRVGIDARTLADQLTGIGRYTDEISKRLVSNPGEFLLYSSGSIATDQWQQSHVKVKSAGAHSRLAEMVWSQTYLPYWASTDKLDVFWGATHRLPPYLPKETARVVTIHDLVWKYHGETMRSLSRLTESILMPQAIKMADRIVTDSKSTAKAIAAEFDVKENQICVVYPGKTELPKPLDKSSLHSLGIDCPYFLFVGTLEPRKNLTRLLRAYANSPTHIRDTAKLVIAGGQGWGNINIKDQVQKLGLAQRVILTGYVTDQQLATLYEHSLFLAMPSLYEGFGLPLVEAMSFGKAVLTSHVSSMPEIGGQAAVLVDPYDESSITKGIMCLLDETTRNQFEALAHKTAENFQWQKAADDLWNIFHEAKEVRKNKIKSRCL